MTVTVRLALCGLLAIALGYGTLRSQPLQAAVVMPDVKADIQKVADAIEKGDTEQAAKMAAEIAKNVELGEVMDLMQTRKPASGRA